LVGHKIIGNNLFLWISPIFGHQNALAPLRSTHHPSHLNHASSTISYTSPLPHQPSLDERERPSHPAFLKATPQLAMKRKTRHAHRSKSKLSFFLFWFVNATSSSTTVMALVCPSNSGSMFKLMVNSESRQSNLSPRRQPLLHSSHVNDSLRFRGGHRENRMASITNNNNSVRNTFLPSATLALLTYLFKPAAALASTSTIDLSESYHLSRIFFLRLLSVVYIAAFSVAKNQNKGLIGGEFTLFVFSVQKCAIYLTLL
jgi:hypothetical protein